MAKKSKARTGQTLREYWLRNGVVHAAHDKALRAWLRKNAAGVDIATFIHSAAHDKKRAQAISALVKK